MPAARIGRRGAWLVLGLCAIALLAYSNSFRSGFVVDNRLLILDDPRVHAASRENIELIFGQEYFYNMSVTGAYRPLTTLSFLFNYAILGNGEHPAAYHWINFVLHAINITLVYLLALLVFEDIAPAFALAAVWALHPLATESVTNIVGRGDLLAALSVLAGLLCHVRGTAAFGWRKLFWLCALIVVATIGFFSKESALVVLPVIAVYDFTFRARASWRACAPGYLALALPLFVFLYVRGQVLARLPLAHFPFVDNPMVGADFWTARLTAIKVIGKYLWLLLWPVRLSCDYSYNQVPLVTWRFHTWEDWQALLALIACVAFSALAVFCYRRNKAVFLWIAFFFATLLPASNLVMVIPTIMGERLTYLPSVGFAGCLVAALYAARPASRLTVPAALVIICLAFAIRTFIRNFDWLNAETLQSSAVQVCPASFKTHMALAFALLDPSETRLDSSIAEIDRGLAILDPVPDARNLSTSYMNAGTIYRRKGDLLAAKNPDGTPVPNPQSNYWYRRSLDVLLRARLIELTEEEEYRRQDLLRGRTRPLLGWYQLYLELGRTYMRLSEPRQALAAYEYGRRLRTTPEFFAEMAVAWRAAGDLRQAAIALVEGLVFDTSQTAFASGLVELYRQIDPQGCAVRNAAGSWSVNFDCPLVHGHVCTASQNMFRLYRQKNQVPAAYRTRQSAINDLGCPAELFE